MLVLNYHHRLTPGQLEQLAEMLEAVPEVRDIPVVIDEGSALGEQAVALADAAGLTPEEWEAAPLVVSAPGLAPAALALIAEIHGRRGEFPALLRLRRIGAPTGGYEVAEVVGLQEIRNTARGRRWPASSE